MQTAIYPGSFDPITYGHLDIIKRSVTIFDKIMIAVVQNPRKHTVFTVDERIAMIQECTKDISDKISVTHHEGLLVDLCDQHHIYTVIRGLRALTDFDYEFQMAITNRQMNQNVDSVLMVTSNEYSYVSSSLVKEIASYQGDMSFMVPDCVEQKLIEKYNSAGGNKQ